MVDIRKLNRPDNNWLLWPSDKTEAKLWMSFQGDLTRLRHLGFCGHDDGDEDVDDDDGDDNDDDHINNNETNLFCLSATPFPRVLIRWSLVDMAEKGKMLIF